MFYSSNNLELVFSRNVLEKLSRLYPQVLYLSLKIKNESLRIGITPEEQRMLNATYANQF